MDVRIQARNVRLEDGKTSRTQLLKRRLQVDRVPLDCRPERRRYRGRRENLAGQLHALRFGFFDHEAGRVECAPNPFRAKLLAMSPAENGYLVPG
jgi:hypothetical protein